MTTSFLILDDFLPADEFEALAACLRRLKYSFRPNFTFDEAIGVHLGVPVYADVYFSEPPDDQTQYNSYPTGTPVDRFFERLKMLADDGHAMLRGKSLLFEVEPVLLPSGAGARLVESDRIQFEYYFHPTWGADWGGELLLDPVAEDAPSADRGRYIAPKGNRLILLSAGVGGAVRRVGPRASHTARCTLRGRELP